MLVLVAMGPQVDSRRMNYTPHVLGSAVDAQLSTPLLAICKHKI